jgi:squalene synthase HpnC
MPAFLQPKDFVSAPEEMARAWTADQALEYTRWLATHHYENFHVVSFLLPKRLHQDFFNVYAFCRWADDLGDEIGDPMESLRLLAWWRAELCALYEGRPVSHPVYVALRTTIERHELAIDPFRDLIHAFEQDQTITRYESWDDVLGYCRYSANPVGRLVLWLCGYRDEERGRLSDSTCTALQLANHWQDVSVDIAKDRVYMPLEVLHRHGASLDDISAARNTGAFRSAMRELVDRTRPLFLEGLPLVRIVDRRLALDLDLFSRGGLRVLDKIERQQYAVLGQRPAVSKLERVGLLLRSLMRVAAA